MYVIYTVNMFIGFTGIDDAKDMYRSMVYTSFTSQMHLISLMVYKLKYLYVQGQCETSWVNLRSSCKLSTFTNIIHLESKLLLHGAAPSAEQGSCDISDGPDTTEYFIYTFISIYISYTNPQKKQCLENENCNFVKLQHRRISHFFSIMQYCGTPVRTPVCIRYIKKYKETSCVSMSSWTRVVSSHLGALDKVYAFLFCFFWCSRGYSVTPKQNRKQIIPI